MPLVRYRCAGKTVAAARAGATLLDVSIANKITHWHECGGSGRCTTCRVRILDGASHLSAPKKRERTLARDRGWDPAVRLACQATVRGDVTLERIVLSDATANQLRAETIGREAGAERQFAFLFCDMRDFTALAEGNSAFDVVHILNRFFETLGDAILLNGGIISHYIGDEICGLFGVDDHNSARSCSSAVRAAVEMVEAIDKLNEELALSFGIRIKIGIGVHYGSAIVGDVGHPTLRRLTVIGDDVNTTSRIQSMAKELETTILVSSAVAQQLDEGSLSFTEKKRIRLRGKREPIDLVAVDAFNDRSPYALAQYSIRHLLHDADAFAKLFYANMFSMRPELEGLFVNGTEAQGEMLAHMLRTVVSGLGRRTHLALGLQAKGRHHIGYGVELHHYDTFKLAMLETVRDVLATDFTPEMEKSWSEALDVILALMKRGAVVDGPED